jgi:hypothetical protein
MTARRKLRNDDRGHIVPIQTWAGDPNSPQAPWNPADDGPRAYDERLTMLEVAITQLSARLEDIIQAVGSLGAGLASLRYPLPDDRR